MMNPIIMSATRKAAELRKKNGFDLYQPVNVYDLCNKLGVTVRFVDVNMEGMYFSQKDGSSPQILLSNQRPFSRRVYTCGHELGHHIFEHGDQIDLLSDGESKGYDSNEFLVDSFSGALLMPVAGVLAEFAKRDWRIDKAAPVEFYIVSSVFGTGYQSLITHCHKNNLLNADHVAKLSRHTPGKILDTILGPEVSGSHFKIVDSIATPSVVDIEVSNYLFIPEAAAVDGLQLKFVSQSMSGNCYIAMEPGITQVSNGNESYFVRVQNSNYVGLAEYRHLENLKEIKI